MPLAAAINPATMATIASAVSLARYVLGLIEGFERGDLTEDELNDAFAALNVSRSATQGQWEDAKRQGGYTP